MLVPSNKVWKRRLIPLFSVVMSLAVVACVSTEVEESQHEAAAIDRSLWAVAISAEQRGDYAIANSYYQQLYRNNPDDPEILLAYVRNLRASGSTNRAIQLLQESLSAGSKSDTVLAELGRSQLAIDNLDGAISSLYEAIMAGNGEWQTFLSLGVAYDRQGDHLSAQRAYEGALLLSNDNVSVLNNLALSHALAGTISKGIALLERAAMMPTANIKIRQNLALLYGISGDVDAAARTSAIDLDDDEVRENLAYYAAIRSGAKDRKKALKSSPSEDNLGPGSRSSVKEKPMIVVGRSATVDVAIDQWEALRMRYQILLQGLNVNIVKKKTESGASQYVALVGPMVNNAQANATCAKLRSDQIYCAVISP